MNNYRSEKSDFELKRAIVIWGEFQKKRALHFVDTLIFGENNGSISLRFHCQCTVC